MRDVREALAVAAGYSDVRHESRTCAGAGPGEADVDYWDLTNPRKVVHYFTDDIGVHPLAHVDTEARVMR